MKKRASANDPLWFKDALIYELHVRAFADSNNDGIGDFQGLISRLDYLQDLGVTCLWLLPFFPSPLRDDGYDIANYVDVNPAYGTLADFREFLDAAHQRNMQVMIELVINHTSDQHPWFKAARVSPPGSPEREMYVWSNTDQLYKDARIIFTDTEKSNWTWDETAKAYYWHRFFSHQPDLNFDSPRVLDEVISAMRFWLDMGVDALRMDAIPYLIERDETSCENLPETHRVIKKIRAAIDAEYENRLVLAEANQWPADVRPYFGDGDECHMAFHFPLMPRIYMALRQEDSLPITDIMAQTPTIPDTCQWGLFLRNHDELTLEMVTDDERDYMYIAYSADPRMRINVGIRRRLAPLLDNNRRRIELLNSLLLSFPGTPILYYGDEIGMGDNIYLGDRNGVRTPMQWNSDRNAGFSKCDPARLYFPVVMDPIYGYQSVNVEMQLSDQSSLLHWTRNMIALRKLFQVFGRGSLTFLSPSNRKILAYLRKLSRSDGTVETVLCVANLSRFAQPVELDLHEYRGMMPVEMLGYVSFPTILDRMYPLTLAPYSFLWFELQPGDVAPSAHNEATQQMTTQDALIEQIKSEGWAALLRGTGLSLLQNALPAWMLQQRWFGSKSKTIEQAQITDYVLLPGDSVRVSKFDTRDDLPAPSTALPPILLFVRATFADGASESYQVPIAMRWDTKRGEESLAQPWSIIAELPTADTSIVIFDATVGATLQHDLLEIVEQQGEFPLVSMSSEEVASGDAQMTGEIRISRSPAVLKGAKSAAFYELGDVRALVGHVGTAEQSNTNIIFGEALVMKLFRKLSHGINPEIEVTRFLTEKTNFAYIPRYLGEITIGSSPDNQSSVVNLQQFVRNDGDGWSWTMKELARFFESAIGSPAKVERVVPTTFSDGGLIPTSIAEQVGDYIGTASLLGTRTAQLHLALATPTSDMAFSPEVSTDADVIYDGDRLSRQLITTLAALRSSLPGIPDDALDLAVQILGRRSDLMAQVSATAQFEPAGQRIRIHGDYHLGQTLRVADDFVILDFEGEPARCLQERRRKQSPLRDVAGMLRSFSYAAWSGYRFVAQTQPEHSENLLVLADVWQQAVSNAFLNSYKHEFPEDCRLLPTASHCDMLLKTYLLEKALYELLYELNNRPSWVKIPLTGIASILLHDSGFTAEVTRGGR